jgi:hypothetical protein
MKRPPIAGDLRIHTVVIFGSRESPDWRKRLPFRLFAIVRDPLPCEADGQYFLAKFYLN